MITGRGKQNHPWAKLNVIWNWKTVNFGKHLNFDICGVAEKYKSRKIFQQNLDPENLLTEVSFTLLAFDQKTMLISHVCNLVKLRYLMSTVQILSCLLLVNFLEEAFLHLALGRDWSKFNNIICNIWLSITWSTSKYNITTTL